MRRPGLAGHRLLQGTFFRGALTIAGGTGAGQFIAIAASPVVTRLYEPSDYGAYAVAASIMALIISVACLGYEYVVPLPESDREATNVLALCLVMGAVVSLFTIPVLAIVEWSGVLGVGASTTGLYLLLLPLGVLGGSTLAALTGWMIRTKSYGTIAANRVTQSVVLVGGQLGLGALGAGGVGLLAATVVSSIVGAVRLGWTVWRGRATTLGAVSRQGMSSAATRYRRFPLWSAPSILLNTLALAVPVLGMVAIYGTGIGGQFAFAQRVMGLPVVLLAASVGQVFIGEAARLARQEPAELRALYLKTTRALALGALAPFVIGAILAPFAFGFIFGEDWREAGLYATLLAPMCYLQFVTAPAGGTLDMLERQEQHFNREILRLALLGGAFVVAAALPLSPVGAVAAISASGCIIYVIYGISAWRAILSHRPRAVSETGRETDVIDPAVGGPGA